MSVQEPHNIMVIPPEEGELNEARKSDNNIIISDYTLRTILLTQPKKIHARYKVMCGCECSIYAKIMNESLLSWSDRYLKKLKDLSKNAQNRRSG